MGHREKAMELFTKGYNCSQAVLCAFGDKTGLDDITAQRLASSFGAGMGRLREVCGAVSGMFMVAGLRYGYDENSEKEKKGEHYRLIQELAGRFREQTGSIICREMLGLDKKECGGMPSERTPEFYKKRPCVELVGLAADLTDEMIEKLG